MNAVEQLLYAAIQGSPADWSLRLDLGRKLAGRGALDEAAALMSEGQGVPGSEGELKEAIDLSGQNTQSGNWPTVLRDYLTENPMSALAHFSVAKNLSLSGDLESAAKFYQRAISLNPALRDTTLEQTLPEIQQPPPPKPQRNIEVVPAAKKAANIEVVPAAAPVAASSIEVVPAAATSPEPVPEKTEDLPPAEQEHEAETPAEADAPAPVENEAAKEALPEEKEDAPESSPAEPEKSEGEKGSKILNIVETAVGKGVEREPEKKEQLKAVYIAIGLHVLIAIWLAYWVISDGPPPPPMVVARPPASDAVEEIKNDRKRTVDESKTSSAIDQMKVSASVGASDFAMPDMNNNVLSGPIGVGAAFGPSMNFGGKGGGDVSFFGSQAKAQKIVFVVDVSASMKKTGSSGKRRFDLMKEELKKSILSLPPGISYQIVFFNGPAWFAGKSIDKGNWHEQNARNFWFYKDDRDNELPSANLVPSTPMRIQQSLRYIDEVKMDYGTDWRSPLKMAMNLEPDLIFFMTDGAVFENPSKTPLVKDLIEYNLSKSKARINCISLMEIGAYKMMKELSDKTKGDISLVLEDSKVLRRYELEEYVKKNR